jgi:hypothetical protein
MSLNKDNDKLDEIVGRHLISLVSNFEKEFNTYLEEEIYDSLRDIILSILLNNLSYKNLDHIIDRAKNIITFNSIKALKRK